MAVIFPYSEVFYPCGRSIDFVVCSMLSSNDFHSDLWSSVTYQVMSLNYVHGYALSSVIPPMDYLDWLIAQFFLDQPASIQVLSDKLMDGRMTWKIIIESAHEHPRTLSDL